MADVSERCEISRQSTPGALYGPAAEPSDPRALAVYWQLLTGRAHRELRAARANGRRLTATTKIRGELEFTQGRIQI